MFKQFTDDNTNIYEFVSNKTYTLNQSEVTRYAFVSGSSDETLSRNYNFARINFARLPCSDPQISHITGHLKRNAPEPL